MIQNKHRENPHNTRLLGLDIYCGSQSALANEICDAIEDQENDKQFWFACINPHSYVCIRNRPQLSYVYNQATWLIPDGAGIVLASKLSKKKITNRVSGPDLFDEIHIQMERRTGARVFFLGASEETLERIRTRFNEEFNNNTIAGTYSPPYCNEFTEKENAKIIDLINKSDADILWVGMTAPKQEEWISEHLNKTTVRFAGAVGAVFDFYAGTRRRPSRIFRALHLEWLPRLLSEPTRLWRRTVISAPVFVFDVLTQYFNGRLSR